MAVWRSLRGLIIGAGAALVVLVIVIPLLASGGHTESDVFLVSPAGNGERGTGGERTTPTPRPREDDDSAQRRRPDGGMGGLPVAQAITLDTDYAVGQNPTADANDWVSVRNPAGTAFTIALELSQGQLGRIRIFLENHSGADAAAVLGLNVPPGFDVGLSDQGSVSEARMTASTWLLLVPATAGDDRQRGGDGIVLAIRPQPDLKPGSYSISGTIAPWNM